MKKKLNKIYIFAFLFLYLMVAAISFCHAIEFFSIGNVEWMSITLAFAFELGLFVCLSSILLGTNKDNTIAWLLLIILVIVQVCGNTYSVFKYISLSETEYYQYLAKPLLFWIEEVSEETVQIIISWIMGAILPIVALLMTEMVSKTIKSSETSEINTIETSSEKSENQTRPEEHFEDEISLPKDSKTEATEKNEDEADVEEKVKEVQKTSNDKVVVQGDLGKTKEVFQR